MSPLSLINSVLPGSGLILRSAWLLGLGLLFISLCCLGTMLLASLVADEALSAVLLQTAAIIYAVLAVLAALTWRVHHRKGRWDRDQVLTLHQQCATAYLHGDLNRALFVAKDLVRLAPDLQGAWRLLAMIAEAANNQQDLRRSRRQLQRLNQQEQALQ